METVRKIDMHAHSSVYGFIRGFPDERLASPEELIGIYDRIGVERGVLMPIMILEAHLGGSTNAEMKDVADRMPDRFDWFCFLDPRMGNNSPDYDFGPFLEYCVRNGAKGVGEVSANMYFDDPMTLNMFSCIEKSGLAMTFHIGRKGGDYGLVDEPGLPRLEKVLNIFPKLMFIGHSQKFWAEISGDSDPEERGGYPRGKVAPGGRAVELLEKYPNMFADLSATSGYNAVSRDPDFGYSFLERFSEKLYYGTDICDPRDEKRPMMKLAGFLDDGMLSGKLSYEAYY
nr:hypothetical protein [Clostridiales bacterium]